MIFHFELLKRGFLEKLKRRYIDATLVWGKALPKLFPFLTHPVLSFSFAVFNQKTDL